MQYHREAREGRLDCQSPTSLTKPLVLGKDLVLNLKVNKYLGQQLRAGQIYSTPATPGQVLSICHHLDLLWPFIIVIDEQLVVTDRNFQIFIVCTKL